MPTCVPVCNCCFDVTSVLAHCIKVVFFSTCRKAKAKILVLCHRACVPMTVGDARATTSNFLRSVPNGSICGCFNVCLFCLCLCAAHRASAKGTIRNQVWFGGDFLLRLVCFASVILITVTTQSLNYTHNCQSECCRRPVHGQSKA